ncbi:MAG: hypothetical protein BGO26_10135 [Actinobacteria bacterium 69-20]|nr:hypothetical protein [Actinomycetota bacterium]OJV23257.1 MAG: hypothetical protein BGO26_10135 [Actinobacteria bacterium 69-20]
MIRLHIALANLRYRLHLLADRIYDWTHEPDLLGDWADVLHRANIARRLDEADGLRWHDGAIRDRQGRYASLHPIEVAA